MAQRFRRHLTPVFLALASVVLYLGPLHAQPAQENNSPVVFSRINNDERRAANESSRLMQYDTLPIRQAISPCVIDLGNISTSGTTVRLSAFGSRAFVYENANPPLSTEGTLHIINTSTGQIAGKVAIQDGLRLLGVSKTGNRVVVLESQEKTSEPESRRARTDVSEIIAVWEIIVGSDGVLAKPVISFRPFASDVIKYVNNAQFIDDDHLVVQDTNGATLWCDLRKKQALVVRRMHCPTGLPLSPGHRQMAAAYGGETNIYDLQSVTRMASYPTPEFTSLAYMPNGNTLVGATDQSIHVLNLVNGKWIADMPTFGIKIDRIAAISNDLILVNGSILFSVAKKSPIWKFNRFDISDASWDFGGNVIGALVQTENGLALSIARLAIPEAAKEAPQQDINQRLVIRPGKSISFGTIDAGGETENVRKILRQKLEANGLRVVEEKADMIIKVQTTRGAQDELAVREHGPGFFNTPTKIPFTDYTVQTTIESDGKILFDHKYGSNIKNIAMLNIKQGQTTAQAIQELTIPKYDRVSAIRIPKYLSENDEIPVLGESAFPCEPVKKAVADPALKDAPKGE